MKYNKFKLTAFIAMLIIFIPVYLFSHHSSSKSGEKGYIFYYNNESNITHFALIKTMFDKYLFHYGDFEFQPFDEKAIFEKNVMGINIPKIMILSSWHFQSLNKEIFLSPILISTLKGKITFEKVLAVKKNIKRVEDLAGKVIASSGSVEYTKSLLLKMLGEDAMDLLRAIKILIVPKDIDALLSVGYGVAEAALTMKNSLNQLKRINPKLKKRMNIFLNSDDILMPVAVIEKKAVIGNTRERLIHILKEMKNTETGREKLALLSIDGWIDISPATMKRLLK